MITISKNIRKGKLIKTDMTISLKFYTYFWKRLDYLYSKYTYGL